MDDARAAVAVAGATTSSGAAPHRPTTVRAMYASPRSPANGAAPPWSRS